MRVTYDLHALLDVVEFLCNSNLEIDFLSPKLKPSSDVMTSHLSSPSVSSTSQLCRDAVTERNTATSRPLLVSSPTAKQNGLSITRDVTRESHDAADVISSAAGGDHGDGISSKAQCMTSPSRSVHSEVMTSPSRSVHSEVYDTVFALQSLGNNDECTSDYLTKVRGLWDGHMINSPPSQLHPRVSQQQHVTLNASEVNLSSSSHAMGDDGASPVLTRERAKSESRVLDDDVTSALLESRSLQNTKKANDVLSKHAAHGDGVKVADVTLRGGAGNTRSDEKMNVPVKPARHSMAYGMLPHPNTAAPVKPPRRSSGKSPKAGASGSGVKPRSAVCELARGNT